MRDPKRINVLVIELQKLWSKYPDIRFGQLIENIIVSSHENHVSLLGIESDLWNWEDERWLEEIKKYKSNYVGGK